MQLSPKQLLDLISLSFQAVMQERDVFTNPDHMKAQYSPIVAEIVDLLDTSLDTAEIIASHLSAIRIGMQLRNENN